MIKCVATAVMSNSGSSGKSRDTVWSMTASSHIRSQFSTDAPCWRFDVGTILARKLLRRGDFASQQILRAKIEQFIDYFNATMAKPFRWTYAGKPLAGAA